MKLQTNRRFASIVLLAMVAPDSAAAIWRAFEQSRWIDGILVFWLVGSYALSSGFSALNKKLLTFNFLFVVLAFLFVLLRVAGPGLDAVAWTFILGAYGLLGNLFLLGFHFLAEHKSFPLVAGILAIGGIALNAKLFQIEMSSAAERRIEERAQAVGKSSLEEGLKICAELGQPHTVFRTSCEERVHLSFASSSKDIRNCKTLAHRGFVFGQCLKAHPRTQSLQELIPLCKGEPVGDQREFCEMQVILFVGSQKDCDTIPKHREWCLKEFSKSPAQ